MVTVSGTPEEELRNLNVLRSHHVDGILWDKLAQSLPACSAALEGIPVRKMACCEPLPRKTAVSIMQGLPIRRRHI